VTHCFKLRSTLSNMPEEHNDCSRKIQRRNNMETKVETRWRRTTLNPEPQPELKLLMQPSHTGQCASRGSSGSRSSTTTKSTSMVSALAEICWGVEKRNSRSETSAQSSAATANHARVTHASDDVTGNRMQKHGRSNMGNQQKTEDRDLKSSQGTLCTLMMKSSAVSVAFFNEDMARAKKI